MPEQWRAGLSRWSRQNRNFKILVDGKPAPSRNEEYFLYQALVGTWPFCNPKDGEFAVFRARIRDYMLKAVREAKVHTSWINPNAPHEEAVMAFIDALLTPARHNHFLPDFAAFQSVTAAGGIFNSLSQTLLKITSPGIPDFYQGNELWDFSLVDPDNRRPVDYSLRKDRLEELIRKEASAGPLETCRDLVATRQDGRIKLHLTYKALNFRRDNRELFETGRYLPLNAEGARLEHVCAFERSGNDTSFLVVVPRLCLRLIIDENGLPLGPEVWQETRLLLPPDAGGSGYRNLFTGEILQPLPAAEGASLALQDILSVYPVALLERIVV
jgi:(1->4)-alpha-D-glucan 1-alpha-D-glucosylmutase